MNAICSPFTHETLLQCWILCPWGALPCKTPLSVDPGEQRDPGQGGVLPVGQTLLEGTTKLHAGLGILQGESEDSHSQQVTLNVTKHDTQ